MMKLATTVFAVHATLVKKH